MKKIAVKAALVASVTLLLVLTSGTAAMADPTSGTVRCTSSRSVGTITSSGLGAVAHSQIDISTDIQWTKSWTNPSGATTRYYNRGLVGAHWGISASNLISASARCDL